MKLVFGIPYYTTIETRCQKAIQNLIAHFSKIYDVAAYTEKGASASIGRQKLMDEHSFDIYVGMDADMEPTPEQVEKLIRRNKGLLFATYQTKYSEQNALDCGHYMDKFPGVISTFMRGDETGIKAADWAGAGLFVITKEYYKKFRPVFHEPKIKHPDGLDKPVSQVIGFCLDVKAKKQKVMVDCDIRISHLIREDENETMARQGWFGIPIHRNDWDKILMGLAELPYNQSNPIINRIQTGIKEKTNGLSQM